MMRSAVVGGAVWAAVAAASLGGRVRLTVIELLFLLAPLVIVPLGLELCVRTVPGTEFNLALRSASWLQLPAAILTAVSFWMSPGIAAVILALPWLCFGCLAGTVALRNLVGGCCARFHSLCISASFLYLLVGCAWLAASRYGFAPLGFHEPIVLLTAVHFHFAGFAAPLLAMATGAAVKSKSPTARRLFTIVAVGVLAGPGLLAAGFVVGPRTKLAMALVVACSEAALSLYFLACIPKLRPRLAQFLISLSAASVLVAMALAAIWAMGEFPLQPFVHLNEMAKFHGTANSLGFVLCGLVGWSLAFRGGTDAGRGVAHEPIKHA